MKGPVRRSSVRQRSEHISCERMFRDELLKNKSDKSVYRTRGNVADCNTSPPPPTGPFPPPKKNAREGIFFGGAPPPLLGSTLLKKTAPSKLKATTDTHVTQRTGTIVLLLFITLGFLGVESPKDSNSEF